MIPVEQPPRFGGKDALDAVYSYLSELSQVLNTNLDELEGRLNQAEKEES